MKQRVVVIGGGAAGFFCAVNVARMNPALQVVLLEKSTKLLSKVKISGGGRCNVSHACLDITEMSNHYPRGGRFVRRSFHEFFTNDTIEWFRVRGVLLKTENDGRMFPVTDSSQTIIDCLLAEAQRYDVIVRTIAEVNRIESKTDRFQLQLTNGQLLEADYVCLACGGFPKLAMFDWLQGTGHTIIPPVPSLFTFNIPSRSLTQLMGVSVNNVKVKIPGTKLEQAGPLLITHWGLSGPVILRLSAWGARELAEKKYEFSVIVNWVPAYNEQSLRSFLQQQRHMAAGKKISAKNPFGLPQRLWDYLLHAADADSSLRWADLPARNQNSLVRHLCSHELLVRGKTTFKEEFVTAGGISLQEIDPVSMESKRVKNLFFAGEIMDVDGITGGYNFQHAWTSGFIAAKTIAERGRKVD